MSFQAVKERLCKAKRRETTQGTRLGLKLESSQRSLSYRKMLRNNPNQRLKSPALFETSKRRGGRLRAAKRCETTQRMRLGLKLRSFEEVAFMPQNAVKQSNERGMV